MNIDIKIPDEVLNHREFFYLLSNKPLSKCYEFTYNYVLQGRVKSKVRNIIVVKVDSDKDRKFTIKNGLMNDICEDDDIEIKYYKRTKAVISIKSINLQ